MEALLMSAISTLDKIIDLIGFVVVIAPIHPSC